MTYRISLWTAIALAPLAGGCHAKAPEAAPEAKGPKPPPGQVWLDMKVRDDAKIHAETVAERDVDDTIVASGRVSFVDEKLGHVFSPVTGRVVQIGGSLGQKVKKGDMLAVIESPDIGSAVSDLHKAQADVIMKEHDFKRQQKLLVSHAVPESQVEASEDAWKNAKAELERAQKKADLLQKGGVDTVSQTFTLVAPIDGEVVARSINPGVEVQGQYGGGTAAELFTVGQTDRVWVMADLYEMDFARVREGSPVKIKVVAYPDRDFVGKIDWKPPAIDPTTRTAHVRVTFDNADRALKPEMYATVEISVEQHKAVAVPHNALLRMGKNTVVFLEKPAKDGLAVYERTPVAVDEGEANEWLPVRSGVVAGDKVVTSNSILLLGLAE